MSSFNISLKYFLLVACLQQLDKQGMSVMHKYKMSYQNMFLCEMCFSVAKQILPAYKTAFLPGMFIYPTRICLGG